MLDVRFCGRHVAVDVEPLQDDSLVEYRMATPQSPHLQNEKIRIIRYMKIWRNRHRVS